MSAVGGGQRRPPAVLYVGAVIFALLISGAGYFVLVTRESVNAEKANAKADEVEAELEKARDFLRRHQNDKQIRQNIDDTAAELKRRVAWGGINLVVGSYLDQQAHAAGIVDMNYRYEGGLKIPKNAGDDKRSTAEHLKLDPAKLQSSVLSVTFTSRYKEFLVFLRSIAEADWPMEVISLEITRDAAKGPKVSVKMQTRYLFE